MSMPDGTLKLFAVSAECGGVCKLCTARAAYKGPNMPTGQGPRPGLDVKYGSIVWMDTAIWGGRLKPHPECKFFFELDIFGDVEYYWDEVWDAFGQPTVARAEETGYTNRNRARWTNIGVLADWHDGLRPMDVNTYMYPGRVVQSRPANNKARVRPAGASWMNGTDGLATNTGKSLTVNGRITDAAWRV